MKKVIFAILIALISTSVFAGKTNTKSEIKAEAKTETAVVSLSGNVIDEVSGEALVGVEIKVEGSDMKTYTDFDGHFVIKNLKPGQCKLVASYTSYNKNEHSFTINSKANQVKIELKASR